jgi:hypothetical protein
LESLESKDYFGGVGVGGRIMLEWTLEEFGEMWTKFIWLRIGTSGAFFLNTIFNILVP